MAQPRKRKGGSPKPKSAAKPKTKKKVDKKKRVRAQAGGILAGRRVGFQGPQIQRPGGMIPVATGQGQIGDVQFREQLPVQPGVPLPGFGQAVGGTQNIIEQLRGFQPGGGIEQERLRGFDPFGGAVGPQAQQTLQELLQTGAITDVAPITEAAQIQAAQEFERLADPINERLAAQGLLSSTARTRALARERGRLAERVAARGLEAGVSAQEAATGRRAGALSPFLAAGGQRLGGLGQAGQLGLGRTGQQLAGQQAALGGQEFLAGTLAPRGFAQPQQATGGPAAPSPRGGRRAGGGFALGGGGGGGGGAPVPQTPERIDIAPVKRKRRPTGGFGAKFGFQRGGQAPNIGQFRDFLLSRGANLAAGFGPQVTGRRIPTEDDLIALGAQNLGGVQRAFELFQNPDELAAQQSAGQEALERLRRSRIGGLVRGPRRGAQETEVALGLGGAELAKARGAGLDIDVGSLIAGLPVSGGFQIGPQGVTEFGRDFGPTREQEAEARRERTRTGGREQRAGQREQRGLLGGKRLPAQIGGEVPGVDDGTDKIPALLRSEEIVIPPDLAKKIISATTDNPILQDIQEVAQRPLEFSEEEGEFVAQRGAFVGPPTPTTLQPIPGIGGFPTTRS